MSTPANETKDRFELIPLAPHDPKVHDFSFDNKREIFSHEMSLVHNVIIRGLNSIYQNAPHIKPRDVTAFGGYCSSWAEMVHTHHHGEEEIIFPFMQAKFGMEENIDGHQSFLQGLLAFEEYVNGFAKGTSKVPYDGNKVRELVDGFGDTLLEHLNEEIPTLAPERMKEFEKSEFDVMMTALENHIKSGPLATGGVFVMVHHDPTTAPDWPVVPAFISFIVRSIVYWRHYSYWKFAPYSRTGQIQTPYHLSVAN